jgi:hypothetical protein
MQRCLILEIWTDLHATGGKCCQLIKATKRNLQVVELLHMTGPVHRPVMRWQMKQIDDCLLTYTIAVPEVTFAGHTWVLFAIKYHLNINHLM